MKSFSTIGYGSEGEVTGPGDDRGNVEVEFEGVLIDLPPEKLSREAHRRAQHWLNCFKCKVSSSD